MKDPLPTEIWTPTAATDVHLRELRVMRGGPAPMHLPEHAHPETQVEVHFRRPPGTRGRAGADPSSDLRPAEPLVIAPTQPHVGRWEAGSEVVVVLVSADLLARCAEELLVRERFEVVSANLARSSWIQQLGAEIRREFRSPFGASRFYLESLGHVLAGHLLRQYADHAPWGRPERGLARAADLRRADAFIDEHLESGFSVGTLARELGLGPARLHRWFKAATGCTPYQYVLRRRSEHARRLLADRRLGLGEIAWRLGFASQSHFTAVFRRATAQTPGAYRENLL